MSQSIANLFSCVRSIVRLSNTHVTRMEQWRVDAETAEEARELLAAGHGYRCEIGDCINIEVEQVEE
jgi:hypothetical protein